MNILNRSITTQNAKRKIKNAGTVSTAQTSFANNLQTFPYESIIKGCMWKRYTEKAEAAMKLITGFDFIFKFRKNKKRNIDWRMTIGFRYPYMLLFMPML